MAAEKKTVQSIIKLNLSRIPWGDFLPCMFAPLVILQIISSVGASLLGVCISLAWLVLAAIIIYIRKHRVSLFAIITFIMTFTQFMAGFLDLLGGLTVPLIMLTLGIYFELKISHPKTLLIGLLLRFGLGFALAFLAIKLFKLNGLSEKIVLLEGLAPAGYNTLIFSVQEKLDVNFAAEFVSVSILIGLVLIPIVLFILG